MRALTRLLVTVIVLGGVLVAADYGVAAVAEQRAAEQASTVLEAPTEASITGWPRGLQLFTGSVEGFELRAVDVPLGPTQIDRLDVWLRQVQVQWADLQVETDRLPPAEEGRFEAELSGASVQQLLADFGDIAELRVIDGGVRFEIAGFGIDAALEARDGAVAILPQATPLGAISFDGLRIDLSEQPGSPAVEEVETRQGSIILRGHLRDLNG